MGTFTKENISKNRNKAIIKSTPIKQIANIKFFITYMPVFLLFVIYNII
jgi:hypothetical protein